MSLYDDLDTIKAKTTEKVAGWSSGIKLLQSQLQLKKATTTQPKRDQARKASLAPVINLKTKKDEDVYVHHPSPNKPINVLNIEPPLPVIPSITALHSDYDWDIVDEYDPFWPNEYEKVVRDMRDQRDRESDKHQDEREREKKRDRKRKSRFAEPDESLMFSNSSPQHTSTSPPSMISGFAGRWEDEEEEPRPEVKTKVSRQSTGAAIAPPPSLQEPVLEPPRPATPPSVSSSFGGSPAVAAASNSASSVAARIMAKYGFKEGQGLGKKEQGMAMALQVEKTSKRGGRIIHEKEIMPPPPIAIGSPVLQNAEPKPQPSITEIMRTPSKIVLLRNMVGPGEVDEDLEPEVKDECNTKYGDVIRVLIHEVEGLPAEEAVRIFVEFKRIESAIKAVVDLNGRFFGGRNVRAGFYEVEKFENRQLMEQN